MTQRIFVDTLGPVVSYPRLWVEQRIKSGAPAEATARRVVPGHSDEPDAFVAATVDTLSTVLDGQHLAGERVLRLADEVQVVRGRRYLLIDDLTGRQVEVTPENEAEGYEVHLRTALPFDVPAGSALVGLAVSVALTADQTKEPTEGAYVLFRAEVNGDPVEWMEPFRVVRRVGAMALTSDRLLQDFPIVAQLLADAQTNPDDAIEAAWRQHLVPLLASWGILDENVASPDVLAPLHAQAVMRHLVTLWPNAPGEYVDLVERQWEQSKALTKQRMDMAVRDQSETPGVPRPGRERTRFLLGVR